MSHELIEDILSKTSRHHKTQISQIKGFFLSYWTTIFSEAQNLTCGKKQWNKKGFEWRQISRHGCWFSVPNSRDSNLNQQKLICSRCDQQCSFRKFIQAKRFFCWIYCRRFAKVILFKYKHLDCPIFGYLKWWFLWKENLWWSCFEVLNFYFRLDKETVDVEMLELGRKDKVNK